MDWREPELIPRIVGSRRAHFGRRRRIKVIDDPKAYGNKSLDCRSMTRKLIKSRKIADIWTVIRWTLLLFFTAVALAQKPQSDQKPRWQPGWPCTGREPSFDPTF